MPNFYHIVASLLAFTVIVQAGRAEDSPVEALQSMNEQALDIVYGEAYEAVSIEEKQAKMLVVMDASFDLSVIVKRAMGANWKRLTEAQQVTTVDLVKQIAVRAIYKALDGAERPQFTYGKLVQMNSKRAELPVTIRTGEAVVYVDFRFGRMRSGWQIFDIVAEDVSFVSNYRQQINDHFRRDDAQALIEKLEAILNNSTTDEDIKL
ncbi:MAG: ABC transporter substrate-binding protein [Verrucomicrobiota bacterium]